MVLCQAKQGGPTTTFCIASISLLSPPQKLTQQSGAIYTIKISKTRRLDYTYIIDPMQPHLISLSSIL